MKRFFLLIIIPLFAMGARADVLDGWCGDDVEWEFDTSTAILTIFGKGPTTDYWGSVHPFAEYNIKKVVVNEGVTSIGDFIFNQSSIAEIEIPQSVTRIGKWAFMDCRNLKTVTVPNKVKIIEDGTFDGCKSLREVVLPSGVESIGNKAFNNCTSLESINLPEGLKAIGDWAFYYCSNLQAVSLYNGLETIGAEAFLGCGKFKEMVVPVTVKSVGNGAFNGCHFKSLSINGEFLQSVYERSYLERLTLTRGTGVIQESAFARSYLLRELTIQECSQIMDKAFAGCTLLESIVIEGGSKPVMGESVFPDAVYDKARLTVPADEYEQYRNDKVWGKFVYIKDGVFRPCDTPTIYYDKGVKFSCTTPGARFRYTITCPDMTEEYITSSGAFKMDRYYEVSVYAIADGFAPSETVKARINMGRGKINSWRMKTGDVNSDGEVNSADVVSIYNSIINGD